MIEREGNLSLVGVLLEELLEGRIGIPPTAKRGQHFPELPVRERQSRLETNRLTKAGYCFLEALLQGKNAAQVLVQVREIRLQ